MATMIERLRNFDWYYMMSDDSRVWRRGKDRMATLSNDLKDLNCPYGMGELRRVAHEQVEDLYEKFENGNYYKPELKAKWSSIAPTDPKDMISREKYEEIISWLENK